MATLFFDGFDRSTTLLKLDSNYWVSQFKNYPQYSFASNLYNHNNLYALSSVRYTPNNGILAPPYFDDVGFSYFSNTYGAVNARYPAIGQPPGFLALTNIAINESVFNLTPLSYLAITGLPTVSGTKSYFGIRCLGIETKHSDYHTSDALIEGRYGAKHPFLAFCSGNTTGLMLNFISVTGDTLQNLRQVGDSEQIFTGKKITIGLEVEQNGGISGIFDLNMADILSDYRITPVYCGAGTPLGLSANLIPTNNPYKNLTIACTKMGGRYANVVSRWTHFEFEIDRVSGILRLKLEGADAVVIDNDEYDRDLWNISINISGFNYDNIRIFNRTYNSAILSGCSLTDEYSAKRSGFYYALGAITAIDDITLIDNTGTKPVYFLGKDSKVLPLAPGRSPNVLTDNENEIDGPLQWSKSNNASNRSILASFDKDNSYIYTSEPREITAIVYTNNYVNGLTDTSSLWRYSYNDGIGGMKVYNHARKEFLDTSIRNVVRRTGLPDSYMNTTPILIHADEDPIIDYSSYNHMLQTVGSVDLTPNGKFSSGISFSGNNSFVVVNNSIYDILTSQFTIEAWIKFNSDSDSLVLFDRKYRDNLVGYPLDGQEYESYSNAGYRFSINTGTLNIESWYAYYANSDYSKKLFCSTPATTKLKLPFAITTGVWHHVALTRNILNNAGYFTVFLDGVSGTGYTSQNLASLSFFGYSSCPGTNTGSSNTGPIVFPVDPPNLMLGSSPSGIYGAHFGYLSSKYMRSSDSAIVNMPYTYIGGTGMIDEYRVTASGVRYSSNFTPPVSPNIGTLERYIEFGPTHDLVRTNYRVFQYYQMTHPESLQPFTSGQVITSGLVLGIKKL